VRCYLDGKLVHDVTHHATRPLYATASRDTAAGELILKAVNTSPAALDTQIELKGLTHVEPSATAIVLTSADVDDENTLDEPTKVAPKAVSITGVGPSFRHTFPAHSVTVVRLKGK
jgi:alpha-L-arabinofuranosidase